MAKASAAMSLQTIPEAARACGRSAREIRLLIEEGKLPAVRPLNQWLIDAEDAQRVAQPTPPLVDERARTLAQELERTRKDLSEARARIRELESAAFGRALKGSSERGALAPLFRATDRASSREGK